MSRKLCMAAAISVAAFPLAGFAQASYVIDSPVTSTNGGHSLDGNDTITVTSSGSVTTGGYGASGLYQSGDNGAMTNNGAITTSADAAFGIYQVGNGANLTNTGSITTAGRSGSGIFITYDDGTIVNSGSVTTTGYAAYGVGIYGDNGSITNTGSITTSNTYGHAMFLGYASGGFVGGSVDNSGTITTSGSQAHGIYVNSAGGVATNSGLIEVSGPGSYAIYMGGTNNTLNLEAGSVLLGDVRFTDTGSTLSFGPGLNAVVRLDDVAGVIPGTITVANGGYAVVGDTVYAVDTTGPAAATQIASAFSGQMQAALANRGGATISPISTQSAADPAGHFWGQVIGGGVSHPATATAIAWSGRSGGVVAGYEMPDGNGYFASGVAGQVEMDGQSLRTGGVIAGLYRGLGQAGAGADLALSLGYLSNTSSRTIANNTVAGGTETATATYSSLVFSPSLTLNGLAGWDNARLSLLYTGVFSAGYTETGSSANLTVAAQASHSVSARLEMRAPAGDGFGLGYGVEAAWTSGDIATASILGTSLTQTAAANSTTGRAFVRVELASGGAFRGEFEIGASSDGGRDARLALRAEF